MSAPAVNRRPTGSAPRLVATVPLAAGALEVWVGAFVELRAAGVRIAVPTSSLTSLGEALSKASAESTWQALQRARGSKGAEAVGGEVDH